MLLAPTRTDIYAVEVHSNSGGTRELFAERRSRDHLDTLPQHLPYSILQESRYGL